MEPFGVCAATGTACPGSSDALSLLRSPLGVPGRFCPFLALLGAEEASLPFSLLRALGAFRSLAAQRCQMGGVGVQPPIPQSNRALGGLHAAQPGAPGGSRLPQPGAGSTLLKPGVSRAPWGDPTPPPHLGCTPEPICGAGERQQSGWERSALSCVLSALFSLPLVTTGRRQLRSGPHRRPTAAPLAPEGPRADRCAPTSVGGGREGRDVGAAAGAAAPSPAAGSKHNAALPPGSAPRPPAGRFDVQFTSSKRTTSDPRPPGAVAVSRAPKRCPVPRAPTRFRFHPPGCRKSTELCPTPPHGPVPVLSIVSSSFRLRCPMDASPLGEGWGEGGSKGTTAEKKNNEKKRGGKKRNKIKRIQT